MFVIRFKCKEILRPDGYPLIQDGYAAWVINEPNGWVEATACAAYSDKLPIQLKLFHTQEEARNFIEQWEGHPWYYVPNGKYEILEVSGVFEKVLVGYTYVAQEIQD